MCIAMALAQAAHAVVQSLAPCSVGDRAALLPSVVRVMLASVREAVVGAEGTEHESGHGNRSCPRRVSGCLETDAVSAGRA